MPDFVFQGPDGKPITVTGPEGSTREEAVDVLRQQRPELWESREGYSKGLSDWGPLHGFLDFSKTPEPGSFMETWDKFGTGIGRGLAGIAGRVGPYLDPTDPGGLRRDIMAKAGMGKPGDPGYLRTPESLIFKPLREYSEGGEKQGPEAAGKTAGEIGATLPASVELGASRLGANALARWAMRSGLSPASLQRLFTAGKVAGAGVEGAVGGAVGGLMQPGDSDQNATTGAATASALGISGEVFRQLPWHYRMALAAIPGLAAIYAAHKADVPGGYWRDAVAMGLGTSLGDLAYRSGRTLPSSTIGAAGARVRQGGDDDDGR
jgi:hypothetical protein